MASPTDRVPHDGASADGRVPSAEEGEIQSALARLVSSQPAQPAGRCTEAASDPGPLAAALERFATDGEGRSGDDEADGERGGDLEAGGPARAAMRGADRQAGVPDGDASPAMPVRERLYQVREVAWLLAAFAAVMLLFDSEGLVTWARRQEVGAVQSGWLALFTPLHRALDAARLTVPRRALGAVGARLARAMGAEDDPLFAEAWKTGDQPADDEPELAAAAEEDAASAEEDDSAAAEAAENEPATRADSALAAPPSMAQGSSPTVLLVGDSLMAGSLGAAINRSLERIADLRVVRAAQHATGLSRPDVFDWMQVVRPLVERERPRFVVCSFGANDAQSIRQGAQLLAFGEPGWNVAYSDRVIAMMRTLAGKHTRVLWLGLPPMRDQQFSRRTAQLNRIFARAARRVPRVEFLELRTLVTGSDGQYATFVADSGGRFIRVRMDDGVHYAPAGARAIARSVVDWIHERAWWGE